MGKDNEGIKEITLGLKVKFDKLKHDKAWHESDIYKFLNALYGDEMYPMEKEERENNIYSKIGERTLFAGELEIPEKAPVPAVRLMTLVLNIAEAEAKFEKYTRKEYPSINWATVRGWKVRKLEGLTEEEYTELSKMCLQSEEEG